jgi:branched-chain amino acid transport system substrate-binding protein
MNLTDGPAKYFSGGRVKFDQNGRREGAGLLIVQWIKGVPVTVYPPSDAVSAPVWPVR